MSNPIKEILSAGKDSASLIKKALDANSNLKGHITAHSENAKSMFNLIENELERIDEVKDEMTKSLNRHKVKLAKNIFRYAKKAKSDHEKLRSTIIKTIKSLEVLRSRINPAKTIESVSQIDKIVKTEETRLTEHVKIIDADMLEMSTGLAENEKSIRMMGPDKIMLQHIKTHFERINAASRGLDELLKGMLARSKEFLDYVQQHDAEILKELRKTSTYALDINSVFRRAGVRPERAIVLIDASFILDVERERNTQRKEYYDIEIPADKIIIPNEVKKEIKRGKSFINYLKRQRNLDFGMKVKRDPQIDMRIRLAWENTTKGRSATEREKKKFINSGDAALLHIAFDSIRNKKAGRVIILAHDNDINGVVNAWRKNGIIRNINVFMLSGGRLVPHT